MNKSFCFYYQKETDRIVLEFAGTSVEVKDINCLCDTKSVWSDNGHPRLKMAGTYTTMIYVENGVATIS